MLAKILLSVLNGCGLVADSSHPCHTLLLPVVNCFCFILDPSDVHVSLPVELQHTLELHVQYHNNMLDTLLTAPALPPLTTADPSTLSPLDPSVLAREELGECSFEEQGVAAEVMSGHQEGLQALLAVHSAMRRGYDITPASFDPMKEYRKLASPGTCGEALLSQQKLMRAGDDVEYDTTGK